MMGVRWRLIAVVAATVGAVVGALAFEALLSLDKVTPFGHTGYGHGVGWPGWAVNTTGTEAVSHASRIATMLGSAVAIGSAVTS